MTRGPQKFTQKIVNGHIRIVPAESRAMSPVTTVLAFVTLCLLTLAVALWFGFLDTLTHKKVVEDNSEKVTEIYSHKVRFGMGSDEVRELYPSLLVAYDKRDRTAGTFLLRNAKHTVWFLDDGMNSDHAYRIQYEKVFNDLSEEDILTHLALRYGRSVYDGCEHVVSLGQNRCHYRWQDEGTSIDLYTRKINNEGRSGLLVTIIAIDTYLESKIIRAGLNGYGAAAIRTAVRF